jgi:fructose-bisphosphate aldolase / 6-deoxy-5-ketofructose 1-phosphate synthase
MNKSIAMMIPADVPRSQHETFKANYQAITKGSNKLLMFACDQKIEHLNSSFYGPGITREDNNPEHLFRIARDSQIGLMATHLGLINRYAISYPTINYLVKLNGKTNLVTTRQRDPISQQLWSVDDVMRVKEEYNLLIRAVGYTVYLGSEFEHEMLTQAAHIIFQAHQHGLLTIIWAYPRGKAVNRERSPQMIAGAAGVAAALGADFVKVNAPEATNQEEVLQALTIAVEAAGRTQLIVSGGQLQESNHLINQIYDQIHKAGTAGAAMGRNLHQRPLEQAIKVSQALSTIIYANGTLDQALSKL